MYVADIEEIIFKNAILHDYIEFETTENYGGTQNNILPGTNKLTIEGGFH